MRISGVTIGRRSSVSAAPRPRNRRRASARPSSVPMTVDTMTTTRARRSVTESASSRSSLANSVGYQSSVKPRHWKFRRESLNEKMIRTTIGANRNA